MFCLIMLHLLGLLTKWPVQSLVPFVKNKKLAYKQMGDEQACGCPPPPGQWTPVLG